MKHEFRSAMALNATVFLTGACLMTVELVAGRIVSRHLGQSLYTWTSVIGVILAGLSLGNYIGGLLSDRVQKPRRLIAGLFLISAVACLSILFLNHAAGQCIWLMEKSWPVRILLHVGMTFTLPALCLGTISPVVAKLAISQSSHTGQTIGAIYAWGTIGSIVGTFATGFYLVAWFGTVAIVVAVAALLGLMALVYGFQSHWVKAGGAALVILWGLSICPLPACASIAERWRLRDQPDEPNTIYFAESQYSYVAITQDGGNPQHRSFYLDKLKHSEIDLNNVEFLQYPYQRVVEGFIDLRVGRNQKPISLLCLGGGGYALQQCLERTRTGSRLTAVEIDPEVTRAAVAAFGLNPTSTMTIVHMDARNYIDGEIRKQTGQKVNLPYELILCDSVSDYSVPYQLTTREFAEQVSQLLSPGGVYIINMIEVVDTGLFLGSVLKTVNSVFAHTQVISCSRNTSERATTLVLASQAPIVLGDDFLKFIQEKTPFDGFVLSDTQKQALINRKGVVLLTDNYAPVENLLAPVVRQDKMGMLTALFTAGIKAGEKGDYAAAVRAFQKSLTVLPNNPDAYLNLGMAYELLKEDTPALDAYAAAIQLAPDRPPARNRAAMLLARMGHAQAASEQWQESLKLYPQQPDVWNNLGSLAMQSGNPDMAAECWRQSLQYAPDSVLVMLNLGRLLAQSGDLTAAEEWVNRALQLEPENPMVKETLTAIHAKETR